MRWQPIEILAPDTEALLWDEARDRCVVGRWCSDLETADGGRLWFVGYGAEYSPSPTHWMPLPNPPQG